MMNIFKNITGALSIVLFALFAGGALAQTAPLGTKIVNTATVTYDHPSGPFGFTTNEASFTVVARETPSTIEFFKRLPIAPDSQTVMLNGSDYSVTGVGAPDDFVKVNPRNARSATPAFGGATDVVPANSYFAGEMIIVRVIDLGQNGDPDVIETVMITLVSESGDEVMLRLYEDGPDTGCFYGYAPSTSEATKANDRMLTITSSGQIEARYVDAFDSSEVSTDTALSDPYGTLFDSLTGQPIDGAVVSIVDAVTGEPAKVYGVDGESPYPSTLVSGGFVTDEGGTEYDLKPGDFLFPLMIPGEYRLVIEPPAGHVFPSGFDKSQLVDLPGGPFEIIEGSYGLDFTVTATGPLHFDVPLDTNRGLTVVKQAGVATASIGDFILYSVRVENRADHALPLRFEDVLPAGFRYQAGSASLDNQPTADPEISGDGRTLHFEGGMIQSGSTRALSYIAAIGPGVKNGEAVNRATAVNPNNRPLSNTAEAAIVIREDLLRSKQTIIGRIAANSCKRNADANADVFPPHGVAGVRVYMETGDFAITDDKGQFHFEGVDVATHVVQLDLATLPSGYEPVICEENSRYAGSAISKFVDAMGGTIWRADFYLKQTAALKEEVQKADLASDVTEYIQYDQAWLNSQDDTVDWVYPDMTLAPSSRSVNLGIKTPAKSVVALSLNGRPVPATNRQARLSSSDQSVVLRRWRGVDIENGANLFEATITHADGSKERLERTVWFVVEAQRARLVDDQSTLVADGRTNPVLAIRLENAEGHSVHTSRIVVIDVPAPYQLKSKDELFRIAPVAAGIVEARGVSVGRDGIARVELEPTLKTGKIRVRVPLANGRVEEIDAYLRAEERSWIVVGLAEGVFGQVDMSKGALDQDGDWSSDGRFALFAKGLIKGDWLLTIAADTAKRRGNTDSELYAEIDPNAYYTLYGDSSVQGHDAESRYPVYVKLEKGMAQILFGDFNTDMNDSELARYSRQLSGLQAVYNGERVSGTAFVAETNQRFAKDEIPADGTSGPYMLSQQAIVRNSETILVETRDRDRPDQILGQRSLERYVDYEIDYETGELIFRGPVDATDSAFNDNVIIVDYETFADAERNITFGGRGEVRALEGRISAGVSVVHEEGDSRAAGHDADLAGVDLTVRITDQTELNVEYAMSRQRNAGEKDADVKADAYLVELDHRTETLGVQAYVREEAAGFGVGQGDSNTRSIRRVGGQANARIRETVNADTGNRQTNSVNAQAYQETALETGEQRTVGEIGIVHSAANLSGGLGLRAVKEELNSGERKSLLATANASKVFPGLGLTLSASREQSISSESDETSIAPERTIFGIDKSIGERVVLNFRHELTEGEHASGSNSIIGMSVQPWTGGRIDSNLSQLTQDSASRLSATVGVDQTFRLNDAWSASLGMANRMQIDGGDQPEDPLADDAISPFADGVRSPLTLDDGFTSAFVGLGYRQSMSAASLRLEMRDTAISSRKAVIFGAARELSDSLSYAGGARLQSAESNLSGGADSIEARLGLSWRPVDQNVVFYDRLDFDMQNSEGLGNTWKLVNNAGANIQWSKGTQVAVFHGIKFSQAKILGQNLSAWTNLAGLELRQDITKKIDVGLRTSLMHSTASSTMEYQVGPSIGFTPKDNLWISVGYNLIGFEDNDFEAAAQSHNGLFISLRLKIDQNNTAEMLEWISPKGRN